MWDPLTALLHAASVAAEAQKFVLITARESACKRTAQTHHTLQHCAKGEPSGQEFVVAGAQLPPAVPWVVEQQYT